MKPLVTVVTPTYNRVKYLHALFKSLEAQTSKNFKWMIVDDGSTDETESTVMGFPRDFFPISYLHKDNGGKHTALNMAFDSVDTELTFIVDSDDILTPDAIESIEKDWEAHKADNLCGISYLRGYTDTDVIGDIFPKDDAIDSYINLRVNKNIRGDKAEVWLSDRLKKYRFPVFENERFLGEGYVWIRVSRGNNMLFRNKILYITKYLEGGLSRSGRALRIRCPRGGMAMALTTMSKEFNLSHRIKQAILYTCYSKLADYSFKQMKENPYPILTILCYPAGFILYKWWKRLL